MQKERKYVILVGDGMADRPLEELGGRTPLEAARTPWMDQLAKGGELGLAVTIPQGFPPGSEIANLSILGYDPVLYYTGRGPLEAASIGVELAPEDVAFRCNLVTLRPSDGRWVMADYSAGHIPSEEARQIISDLEATLGGGPFSFFPGVGYRHLLIWRRGRDHLETTPPHDIMGREVGAYLPRGEGAKELLELIEAAREVLEGHPVNRRRSRQGKPPANSIWPWGQGRKPRMPTLQERYGLRGRVVAAVDLIKGIGIYAGLEPIQVPGATGWLDTDYRAKADYGLEALEQGELLYLHVEAPDEASHMGDLEEKIRAIERFDQDVVRRVVEGMRKKGWSFRLMVITDHPTPLQLRTHVAEPVPFLIYDSSGGSSGGFRAFSEREAERGIFLKEGFRLLDRLVQGDGGTHQE